MIRNFVNGDIVTSGTHFAKGKEATRQAVIRHLRLFLGNTFGCDSRDTMVSEHLGKNIS